MAECVVRVDSDGVYMLLDRETGVEYARGTEADVVRAAAGDHTITEAPRLGPVQLVGRTRSQYLEFVQLVAETVEFDGRLFFDDESEWISGILYPDHLGIGFTERLADLPQFVRQVERAVGRNIDRIKGVAAVASTDEQSLLGDWIENGVFQPERLLRRFRGVLGGQWRLTTKRLALRLTTTSHVVEIVRDERTA